MQVAAAADRLNSCMRCFLLQLVLVVVHALTHIDTSPPIMLADVTREIIQPAVLIVFAVQQVMCQTRLL